MTYPRLRFELHFADRMVACYADRPIHIDAMLRAAVDRAPDRAALVSGAQRITYRALDRMVDRVAANLLALGLRRGDRLALLVGNRIEFVLAMLGAIRAGVIIVPVGTRLTAPEIAFIVANCEAAGLIYDAALNASLPQAGDMASVRNTIVVGEGRGRPFAALLAVAGSPPPGVLEAEDIFCLLYTSGTTGRPKGAKLTHLGAVHSALTYQYGMGLEEGEVSVLAVPASHVTGIVAVILAMIRVAGSIVLMETFKARDFIALAARERMTHALLVPAMYNLCLLEPQLTQADLSAWRIGGFGGSAMPVAAIEHLARLLPRLTLINAYGSTETTSPVSLMPRGEVGDHPDTVGRPVPGAHLLIVDEAGREVERGAIGEIWAAGPMVVPGYWADPRADAAGFAAGYWRSGDLGSIDAHGYLRVLDRQKDMINRAGYKVYCIEVENALADHPDVIESAVVGRPDPVLDERVHAFIVARQAITVDGLRAFLAPRLADYKIPDAVTLVADALPRNANGKVMKDRLRARFTDQVSRTS
jgi:acyl-CoA synthetase (AMP-forming)/AMP-acid ligase II